MNCQIYPERPFWKQAIELTSGVELRIHGLTSTLLSGQNGEDDVRGSLYLSPLQKPGRPGRTRTCDNAVMSGVPV